MYIPAGEGKTERDQDTDRDRGNPHLSQSDYRKLYVVLLRGLARKDNQ